MIKNFSYTKGFTLIEVIIYLSLFAILMFGSLSASFNLFESSGRGSAHALLAEEGSFIIAKTHHVLSGAALVAVPGVGSSSRVLSVQKGHDTVVVDPAELVGGVVVLTSVGFYHAAATGVVPESVGVRFTLSTRTREGVLQSQEFFSTTSLRQ